MTGYDAYVVYLAMKMHFTQEKYDYVKYHGKVNTAVNTYNNRRDRYQFEKLGKHYSTKEELELFLVANYTYGKIGWIGDLFEDTAKDNYLRLQKQMNALSFNFREEWRHALDQVEDPHELFKRGPKLPLIIQMILAGEIDYPTLCILDRFIRFSKKFDDEYKHDYLWDMVYRKMRKLQSFINIDESSFANIIKEEIYVGHV
jgi:hypothetical protein